MNSKILFIDDDPIIHALYTPHLRKAGYEVIGLTEADGAVQVATKEQPGLIVTDMVLPGQDGLTTILQLKSSEATKQIPIIAVSANASLRDVQEQLGNVGVEVFLTKPFGPAKLVAEIARFIPAEHSVSH